MRSRLSWRRARTDPHIVTIYSRVGCHLCEEVVATAQQVVAENPGTSLEVLDLDEAMTYDAGLAAYVDLVPVTLVDGRRVAHWYLNAPRLRDALDAPAGRT